MKFGFVVASAWTIVGCSGGDLVDLARSNGSSAGSSGVNAGADSSASDAACAPVVTAPNLPADAGASVRPLLGRWTGYVESETFASGSDALSLVFTATDGGPAAIGTVTFGSGTPAPPPTDGTTGYNPGTVAFMPSSQSTEGPIEGYPYTVLGLQFDGARVRFGVRMLEPYRSWCELQTSYPFEVTDSVTGVTTDWRCMYECSPPGGAYTTADEATFTNRDGGAPLVFTGNWYQLCVDDGNGPKPCTCSASGCTVDMHEADLSFDAQLTAGRIDGSFAVGSFVRNVHFSPAVGSDD